MSQDELPLDYANPDPSDPSEHCHCTLRTNCLSCLRKRSAFGYALLRSVNLGGEPRVAVGVLPREVFVLFSELGRFPRTVSFLHVPRIIHVNRSPDVEGPYDGTHQRLPVHVFVQESVSQRLHLVRYARVAGIARDFRDMQVDLQRPMPKRTKDNLLVIYIEVLVKD
jgi:hypothetical protein